MVEKDRINNRITIALDDSTSSVLKSLKDNITCSQSELIRKAIKFYYKFHNVFQKIDNEMEERLNSYMELLAYGEHIILDIDYYLSFLKFIEESSDRKKYWEINRIIGKAHAEEYLMRFKDKNIKEIIKHLETCNFFKLAHEYVNKYILLLGSDIQKKFVKIFLEEILKGMGFNVLIKEGFSKLTIIKIENGKIN